MLDAIPDESAGKAMKATIAYFEDRECENGNLDPLALALFAALKTSIDEAYADFAKRVENGKSGGRPLKPVVTNGNHCKPLQTEVEAEAEVKEIEADGEERKEVFSNEKTNKRLVSDPELNKALLAYIDFREKADKPMTDYAVQLMIEQLGGMANSTREAVEIVNQSIVRGWMGIFPLAKQTASPPSERLSEREADERAAMDKYLDWDDRPAKADGR